MRRQTWELIFVPCILLFAFSLQHVIARRQNLAARYKLEAEIAERVASRARNKSQNSSLETSQEASRISLTQAMRPSLNETYIQGAPKLEHSVYDLHFHSSLSDGTTPVDELVAMINTNKMKVVSLTDHNKLMDRDKFAAFRKAVNPDTVIIPGVEMTGTWDVTLKNPPCVEGKAGKVSAKDVHLLGYFPFGNVAACRPKGNTIDEFPTTQEAKTNFPQIGNIPECSESEKKKWTEFTETCQNLIKGRLLRNRLIAHNIRELFRIKKMRDLYKFKGDAKWDKTESPKIPYDQITDTLPTVDLDMFGRPNFYKWATKLGMEEGGLFGPTERQPLNDEACMWYQPDQADEKTKVPPLLHDCMSTGGWERLKVFMNKVDVDGQDRFTYIGSDKPEYQKILDQEITPEPYKIYALPQMASASLSELSSMIKGLGGVTVLAHPSTIMVDAKKSGCGKKGFLDLDSAAKKELVDGISLWGLEAFSSEINEEAHNKIAELAGLTDKKMTGGSDFHGVDSNKKDKSAFAVLQPIGDIAEHTAEQSQFTEWKRSLGEKVSSELLAELNPELLAELISNGHSKNQAQSFSMGFLSIGFFLTILLPLW